MSNKKMLIDATHAEETRVVVVDGNKVEEFDFESINKRQLAGNIYLAKVTRVEPSLQAAFIDYGGNRHGFLAFSEIHPDYYQIPVADREALLEEERLLAETGAEEENEKPKSRSRRRTRKKAPAKAAENPEPRISAEADADIPGMDVVDLGDQEGSDDPIAAFDASGDAQTPAIQPEVSVTTGDADEIDADELKEWAADQAEEESAAETDGAGEPEPETGGEHPPADIESVAQEDEQEEIRPRRKPRPRRYKIQEVIKVRQILLIQVVKEERGNKGAALTTYLSLAGRYCVLMPNTARGGGISRKITNAADRKKLKDIASGITVPQGAGLIIRTAGAKRTKAEIKRDYDYLLRQWEQVRDLTLKSIAPAPIYEEGSLIKRSIRDLYNREINEILIEGDAGYRMAKDYMKMLMPSHAKNVKHYSDQLPLFARFQVESYLAAMFNPNVQLRSGGYIVIGVTEALVALDVNSGKATKENSIEDTALKTNLEAAEEVARQLRLRDLAGLIVIDFIDMEDRRNNAAVEKRIKDRLKTDRARIQVGRISGFGLMEMSRQRLRPGMIEATTKPCQHCHGTGLTRSDDNLALAILRELEEEGVRQRVREVLVTAPVAIANYMLNQKREHIAMIESRFGLSVRIEASPLLISPDYEIEKLRTPTRNVPRPSTEVVSMDTSMAETTEPEEQSPEQDPDAETTEAPRKKRRRRRRRGGRGRSGEASQTGENTTDTAETTTANDSSGLQDQEATQPQPETQEAQPAAAQSPDEEKPAKRTTRRSAAKKAKKEDLPDTTEEASENQGEDKPDAPAAPAETEPEAKKPKAKPRTRRKATKKATDKATDGEPQPDAEPPAPKAAPPDTPETPKRRGWWSRK
ncbi:MAG: ribonuclease E/G [Paracoccaceae bacterium]